MKSNSYTKGNTDAEVTWLEFSDFGCTYCQKMHATDKTPSKVLEEYGEKVNIIFMNMPFRNREASEAVECI
ncbi:MAG: DsbA family protein [Patescibacteria group bacterium]